MKKTVDITMGGKRFHLEDDAYERMQDYLRALEQHFAKKDDGKEILEDIESAIAEHMSQATEKRDVVMLEDVEAIITQMGTVHDFASDAADADEPSGDRAARKLYRDTQAQVIGGVCAGLAAYTGVDVTVVRIIFLVSILFGGGGILVYIILWLAMPEAKTVQDEMRMRGEPLTVVGIEERVRTAFSGSAVSGESTTGRLLLLPFRVLGDMLRAAFRAAKETGKYVRALVGGGLIAFAVAGIGAVIVMGIIFFFRMSQMAIGSQMKELLTHVNTELVTVLLAVIFAIPLVFTAMLGVSILQRKNRFSIAPSFVLIAVWLFSLAGFSIAAIDLAPHVEAMRIEETREYPMASQSFDYTDFSELHVEVPARITVTQGDDWRVSMTGDERALEEAAFDQYGDTLRLDWTPAALDCIWFCHQRVVDVVVTMPELTSFKVAGRVEAEVAGFKGEELVVWTGSGAEVALTDVDLQLLTLETRYGSTIELAGSTDELSLVTNTTVIRAFGLAANAAFVASGGFDHLELNVKDALRGSVGYGTELWYRGSPSIGELYVEDEARIIRTGEE